MHPSRPPAAEWMGQNSVCVGVTLPFPESLTWKHSLLISKSGQGSHCWRQSPSSSSSVTFLAAMRQLCRSGDMTCTYQNNVHVFTCYKICLKHRSQKWPHQWLNMPWQCDQGNQSRCHCCLLQEKSCKYTVEQEVNKLRDSRSRLNTELKKTGAMFLRAKIMQRLQYYVQDNPSVQFKLVDQHLTLVLCKSVPV